ncbi:TPA: sigma-54-dependent Fis family transcriptional regulator, partial [Candidatus Sumerlaeota bacterium]|nr:sigma-54-dependent Fis family transcriptional regulator [Candidatus Sumerlaeota bacterium]
MTTARILIADDEPGMQAALREVLTRQGYQVQTASDGVAALAILESEPFDLLITDVRMPEMGGIELLERARRRQPYLSALVMTAFGTVEDAVDAMKKGATDYLLKPFSTETIEKTVTRVLQNSRVADAAANAALVEEETELRVTSGVEPISASPLMHQVLDLCKQVADSVATVLLQGESGSGKEVIARYIHQLSGRGNGPFVAVNCAALPEGLLESELFGHEKGA